MTGAKNVPEAIKHFKEIDSIISSGAMKLRKISSNNEEFLQAFPKEDLECPDERNKLIGVLGLKYNASTDQIQFDVQPIDIPGKITKRHILSEIAKIHDPEGLLGPVTFNFKQFMKTVWMTEVSWDEEIPMEEQQKWIELAGTFASLNQIRINRQVLLSTYIFIQIHGFSDASEKSYGAVVYIVCWDSNENHASNILAAKSRIAPKERRSIARLELCGAVVRANLMDQVLEALIVPIQRKFSWLDSAIALHWIKKSPSQLQPFVANRVSQIQELSNEVTWRHVRGEQNPADLISRGLLPEELISNNFWWHGPNFLCKRESEWPFTMMSIDPEDPLYKNEFKKVQAFVMQAASPDKLVQIIENSSRLYTATVKIANLKRIAKISGDFLSVAEMSEALNIMIRLYQQQHFKMEIDSLIKKESISTQSSIKNLDPFWKPNDQLLRVGGRLSLADCHEDQRHPILLPKCHLATLIIRETHEKHGHAGQHATLGHLRSRFWSIQAKNSIRKELHRCITCCRARPKLIQQFMGQLPKTRTAPSFPFYNVGIDYAGPFSMKIGSIRNARTQKVYAALFVCMVTKAIHIEAVTDLSTKAFIAALDRFSSRRGFPKHIYSDNGTNFVGANNELKKLYEFLKTEITEREIYNHLAQNEVTWHHIPPRAPLQGGLWEAGVKSMKYHLTRTTKDANLTYEEFSTVLSKIEAILNSRPLTAISDAPNDFSALTAGHFLIQRPLTEMPQRNLVQENINRLQRWDRILHIQQRFWKRWSSEYLHQLQIRTKQYKSREQISVNDLVLLQIENTPGMQWPMGRIISLQPGKDGISRVATIKTSSGIYVRPVSRIAILPVKPQEDFISSPGQDVNDLRS